MAIVVKYLPWFSALLWLVLRVSISFYVDPATAGNIGAFANLMAILVVIFVGINLRNRTRQQTTTFGEDLKACLRQSMTYVIAATLALGIYYGAIGKDIEIIRDQNIRAFNAEISTEEGLNKLKSERAEIKDKSREEIQAMHVDLVKQNVSLHMKLLMSSVALMLASIVYSILGVVLWRFMRPSRSGASN
jgi:hypothetical protein